MKNNSISTYYISMVNKNKPYYKLRVPIPNILEIRLNQDTWERISQIAVIKGKSYSWVVRYCLFRFIKRNNMKSNPVNFNSEKQREKYTMMETRARHHLVEKNLHRHKLCLYGDDELYVRMIAGFLHRTMSHLVRLALEWYLSELERMSTGKPGRFHRLAFYWLGIKLYGLAVLPNVSPEYKQIQFIRFSDDEYW
ncbi:MAG: hypothetical protein ABUK01_12395 [Leptospirales bacterium]